MKQYEDEKEKYIAEHGSEDGFIPSAVSSSRDIVNKGESFVYYDGVWFDWTDVKERMRSCGLRPDNPDTDIAGNTSMDNFLIHAYSEYAIFSVDHRIKEQQDKPYNPGDEVVCTVSVLKEPIGFYYTTGVCDVYAGDMLIGSFDEIYEGDTVELEYTYTVTESDLERGYFENTVEIYADFGGGSYWEYELLDELYNTTVRADVSEPETKPDTEPESKPDTDQDSKPDSKPDSDTDSSADKSSNPRTGAASVAAVSSAVVVLSVMILKKRRM